MFGYRAHRNDELVRELIHNRVAALVLEAAKTMAATTGTDPERANTARVQQVLDWIDAHEGEPVTSESLAQLAGLSEARFHVHSSG
ncbi:MAG: hypothetical protein J0M04_06615 [Verrucomicrobia bacterium]|nr:hypothetical protein [Verrucomicrobiota bacterium]